MIMIRFPKDSIIRIITGLIVTILVIFLVKYHPIPEYYNTSGLFKISNFWIFQMIIPSVLLPLILSFFLIFKTIIKRNNPQNVLRKSLKIPFIKRLSFPFKFSSAFIAFLLGTSGFIAMPVIAGLKLLYRNQVTGAPAPLKMGTLFYPEFSYPFFLGVISIGFLLWFIIENKKNGYEPKHQFNSFTVILCCSALFFVIINYGVQHPEYKREIIFFDRNSGIIKWKRECLIGPAVNSSKDNSQATPTPLIDRNSVFAYFGSAGFISTDNKGHVKWENTNLPFECIYGVGASPIFSRNGIIVLNSMSKAPYLTSLDLQTGKRQWTTILPSWEGLIEEHRTPILYELNGQELIIEWNTTKKRLALYESTTGKIFYQYNTNWETGGNSIATPIINEGVLYLPNKMSIVAIDIFKMVNGESPIIWVSELNGNGPNICSPVLSAGMLFMISDNGFVSCLDSKTGKQIWQEKLKGLYFSSPISTGERIYFSDNKGVTTVIECSPKFRKIAENYLPEGIYSTLVPVDGQLFIRTENTLWCLKQLD
jgi:outer membrane protein assembly factor BamB